MPARQDWCTQLDARAPPFSLPNKARSTDIVCLVLAIAVYHDHYDHAIELIMHSCVVQSSRCINSNGYVSFVMSLAPIDGCVDGKVDCCFSLALSPSPSTEFPKQD